MAEAARRSEKSWEKPQLIVLVRSQPEESVLTACKLTNSKAGGTSVNASKNAGCQDKNACNSGCSGVTS